MFKTEGRTFTRDEFFTECKKAADEFQALRKAVGSTVDLTHGYYAEVGASAWAIGQSSGRQSRTSKQAQGC
jgi:hypothetical protein